MSKSDNFFEKVYEVAKLIPYGRVTSYGAIAKYLGAARSARMVGWAMNASHNNDQIPAHRVVNRKGLLTGKFHFDGTNLMQQLLENEGVVVIDNEIQSFEAVFWDPFIENSVWCRARIFERLCCHTFSETPSVRCQNRTHSVFAPRKNAHAWRTRVLRQFF